MTTRASIDGFLDSRRLAMVGVSRDEKDFSRYLYKAFAERGYDVVPVNAAGGDVDERPCARRIGDVEPPVEAALLLTPPTATEQVVRDCAESGVRRVWMHRGAGQGAVSDEAVAYCHERGIDVVDGACPLMFLPNTGLLHRTHRFFARLGGRLPH